MRARREGEQAGTASETTEKPCKAAAQNDQSKEGSKERRDTRKEKRRKRKKEKRKGRRKLRKVWKRANSSFILRLRPLYRCRDAGTLQREIR